MTQPYYDPAAQQQPGPYPPAPPQQPGYGQPAPQQAWQQPQPGYGQPAPQQGYPQGYQQQMPPQPAEDVRVGLADYFDAPSAGFGPSLAKFFKGQPGQRLRVQVARALTDADVKPSTIPNTNPVQYKRFTDGRVMTFLSIPVYTGSAMAGQDGKATWNVQGQARDELTAAMQQAGVPADQLRLGPEAGAEIDILLAGKNPASKPGMNDANVWQITYFRPQGAANGQPAQQAPAPPQGPVNGQALMQQYAPEMQHAQQPPQGSALAQAAAPEMAQMAQSQGQQFAQAGAPVGPGAPQGYQPAPPAPPQQYGMQSPAVQVAAATQAAQQAAQQHMPQPVPQPQFQAPQQVPQQGPPGTPPDRMNLLTSLAGPQAARQYAQGQPAPQQ